MNRVKNAVFGLAMAGLVLGAGASAASAAPQGPWTLPVFDLSAAGEDASSPRVASAPDGTTTAVWSRNLGLNKVIQVATRPAGAPFGDPVDLTPDGQSATEPEVATAPDGTATVVWRASNGPDFRIRAAIRPPGGSFGTRINLSDVSVSAVDPEVDVAPDGTTTAVWSRFDFDGGGKFIIQAATRPPGGSFGTPVDLSEAGGSASQPQATTAPDGTTTVVWRRQDEVGDSIIQVATRPPGGSFGVPVNLSAPGENAFGPEITTAFDGTTTAVWSRLNGLNSIVQATTRPPGGTFGTPVNLSATAANAEGAGVTTAPDGTTTAVWYRFDGANRIVQATTRPPGGSFGSPVDVSATGQNADEPQIATAPDGTATAVWSRSDGANDIIQAATRPPGGAFETPVNLSAPGGEGADPQVAVAPDGTATAVWYRSDGANNIIQATSTARPSPLLQVNPTGTGTGTVSSTPAGIDCGSDCAENFPSFTEVTLAAVPDPGSTFTGWSGGGCSGSGTCEVTMLEAVTVEAEFTADPVLPAGKPKLANLKITPKSKKVRRGKKTTFKVKVKNTGNATAKKLKLCAKGPKKLVKVPKCAKPGNLAAGKSKTVKMKVKVKKGAKKGRKAKVTFTATATGGFKKTGKATVKVK